MAFHNAELKSLGDILAGFDFVIPDYQRGYAWQQEQWEALWRDAENISKQDATYHFTGMLLLRPTDAGSDKPRMEVVDGQQRLITSAILCNALRQQAGQKTAKYPLTFMSNDELQCYFDFYVNGDQAQAPRLPIDPSTYARNLKGAYQYFSEQAGNLDKAAAQKRLRLLNDSFKLFVLHVSDDFDIHIAFETLNNRGRKLSHMELLKNRLIYLSSILKGPQSESEKLRRDIHTAWKGIYRSLGRERKSASADDEFLLAHATAYFKKRREAEWLSKTLFDVTFSASNPDITLATIKDYVSSLENAAAWWGHIHNPSRLPPTHQKNLERIDHAGFAYFKPLILAAYIRASRRYPASAAAPSEFAPQLECVNRLLVEVERYIVVVFRFLEKSASVGRADADSCAYSLYEKGRKDALVNQGLPKLKDEEAVRLVADFIRACVSNQVDEGGHFSDPRFEFEGEFNKEDARIAVEQRFKSRRATGYYKWDFTRILLVEYEESFRDEGNNPSKLSWDQFSFDETVEHIYPQTPTGKGEKYWKARFDIDGRSNRNDRISKALTNSLGNLLFLSRKHNSTASNAAYVIARGEGKRVAYEKANYSANEVAKLFSDWDAGSIAARGVKLLKFAEQRWQIELTATPDKPMSYLPLCFGPEANDIKNGKGGRAITNWVFKGRL